MPLSQKTIASKRDDGMDIGETGKTPNAPTPSDKGVQGEETKTGRETPRNFTPGKYKKIHSPHPPRYAAEYIDPSTGQTVRKLAITQPSPFQPKKHQATPEKSAHSGPSHVTPTLIDTAVKRGRSTEDETVAEKRRTREKCGGKGWHDE